MADQEKETRVKPQEIRVAGIVEESIVDGPGFRLAVFTQGCTHNCPGCHNPHTHDMKGGTLMKISDIVEKVKKNPLLDGITLTGGDPFMQPEASAKLAEEIKALGLSVVTYTGYTWEQILCEPKFSRLLNASDILVDGPFIQEQKSLELRFRGSKNQRVIHVKDSLLQNTIVMFKEE